LVARHRRNTRFIVGETVARENGGFHDLPPSSPDTLRDRTLALDAFAAALPDNQADREE
jgi:hypothetical protein